MAHMLEDNDGIVSFAGDKPAWHRLGTVLDRSMTIDEALAACFGDRTLTVEEVPLPEGHTWAGTRAEKKENHSMKWVILGGWDGVTASGALASIPPKVMPTLFSNYELHTPRDMMSLAEEYASQSGATWSSAGFTHGGTRFFCSLREQPLVVDPNGLNDVIGRYVTALTSFDGSKKTMVLRSHIRAVCNNTVQAAVLSAEIGAISTKHSSGSLDRAYDLARAFAAADHADKHIVYQAEKLLRVEDPKHSIAHGVCDLMFGQLPEKAGRARTINENRRDTFWQVLLNEKNVGHSGWNGWSIFNAAVEYLDHHVQVNGAADEAGKEVLRQQHQMDGTHDAVKAKVADFILSAA